VIAEDGSQLGILPTEDALRRAEERGLDLVEVQPMARPPVCKIMDYGKFKYEQKRKASELKKKQTVVEVKEVKFRPKTGEHDFQTKLRHLREFLQDGNKARVTIMFRGREIVHPEIGHDILKRLAEAIADIGQVEMTARMEGKQMFMIVAPGRAPAKRPMTPGAPAPTVGAAPGALPSGTAGSSGPSPSTLGATLGASLGATPGGTGTAVSAASPVAPAGGGPTIVRKP
jgi:translation initiation factor IF-3